MADGLFENNRRALKSFLLWRQKKNDEESEFYFPEDDIEEEPIQEEAFLIDKILKLKE